MGKCTEEVSANISEGLVEICILEDGQKIFTLMYEPLAANRFASDVLHASSAILNKEVMGENSN